MNESNKGNRKCFVCELEVAAGNWQINNDVLLPVCIECIGTEMEKEKVEKYLDSLADGLICGCI